MSPRARYLTGAALLVAALFLPLILAESSTPGWQQAPARPPATLAHTPAAAERDAGHTARGAQENRHDVTATPTLRIVDAASGTSLDAVSVTLRRTLAAKASTSVADVTPKICD